MPVSRKEFGIGAALLFLLEAPFLTALDPRRGFLLVRHAGTPGLRQDHLEDDAHRPLEHFWTGLRRHAERGQRQQQPLGEQGIQHGI